MRTMGTRFRNIQDDCTAPQFCDIGDCKAICCFFALDDDLRHMTISTGPSKIHDLAEQLPFGIQARKPEHALYIAGQISLAA